MDYSVLERSTLFRGIPAQELRNVLESTPHHIQCYDKEETIFHMMDSADRIGIVLEGRAQAQKAAFWLLMQARQSGKDAVKIPGSFSKWAMLMNVSRPSLHRELKKLGEKGIVSYSAGVVRILDSDALQDVLSRS